jgi:hypothetical protein
MVMSRPVVGGIVWIVGVVIVAVAVVLWGASLPG